MSARWIIAPLSITLGVAEITGRFVLEIDEPAAPKKKPRRKAKRAAKKGGRR